MGKEVLAVDVDEVFKPFLSNFLIDHNSRYGTDHRVEDFESYHFEGTLGLTVPETVGRVFDYLREDHSHIEPIEGAQEAIDRLQTRFDIEVITARDPQFEANTDIWLRSKLGDFFTGLNMVGYSPIMEKPVTKAEICVTLGAVAMIDDSLSHIKDCVEAGVEGVLFGDYVWNQADELPAGVTRCVNWPAVAEHFGV